MEKEEQEGYHITYNPHFKEYHAISNKSECSKFSSKSRDQVVLWILKQDM